MREGTCWTHDLDSATTPALASWAEGRPDLWEGVRQAWDREGFTPATGAVWSLDTMEALRELEGGPVRVAELPGTSRRLVRRGTRKAAGARAGLLAATLPPGAHGRPGTAVYLDTELAERLGGLAEPACGDPWGLLDALHGQAGEEREPRLLALLGRLSRELPSVPQGLAAAGPAAVLRASVTHELAHARLYRAWDQHAGDGFLRRLSLASRQAGALAGVPPVSLLASGGDPHELFAEAWTLLQEWRGRYGDDGSRGPLPVAALVRLLMAGGGGELAVTGPDGKAETVVLPNAGAE